MNKDRRKQIAAIAEKLEALRCDLETLRDEEQDYYDCMPEGIQSGEKGEKAQSAIDALDSAMDELNGIDEYLVTAQE